MDPTERRRRTVTGCAELLRNFVAQLPIPITVGHSNDLDGLVSEMAEVRQLIEYEPTDLLVKVIACNLTLHLQIAFDLALSAIVCDEKGLHSEAKWRDLALLLTFDAMEAMVKRLE